MQNKVIWIDKSKVHHCWFVVSRYGTQRARSGSRACGLRSTVVPTAACWPLLWTTCRASATSPCGARSSCTTQTSRMAAPFPLSSSATKWTWRDARWPVKKLAHGARPVVVCRTLKPVPRTQPTWIRPFWPLFAAYERWRIKWTWSLLMETRWIWEEWPRASRHVVDCGVCLWLGVESNNFSTDTGLGSIVITVLLLLKSAME